MYIDAKRIGDRVFVSEKNNDKAKIRSFVVEHVFYYEDAEGPYQTISGSKVSKFITKKYSEFKKAIEYYKRKGGIYESDIDPVYRLLEEKYPEDDGPKLNVQFLDIETDKDPKLGFATIDNPYAHINGVTVYNEWEDKACTILLVPDNLSYDDSRSLLDGKLYQDKKGNIVQNKPEDDDFGELTEENGYILVKTEEELLVKLLLLMEDADVITGWNSEFFDIPYLLQRIRIVLGEENIDDLEKELTSEKFPYSPSELSSLCFKHISPFPCLPTLKRVEHFGSYEKVYKLHGRVHLDYLELYRKFTYEELHSYTLDFILQHEVNQTKVVYEGSLDQLYRNDLRRFAAYNRQDVMGLYNIDKKRRFIELANSMAHMAGVTLDKVLGSVVLIEQAILKELHKQKKICFNKPNLDPTFPIPGAFVLEPQKGKYEWIASYDYNSLYPTLIRALNISPETIMGYVRPKETLEEVDRLMEEESFDAPEAWAKFIGTIEYQKVLDKSDDILIFEDEATKEEIEITGRKLNDIITNNNCSITAFGLVISNEAQGIIPFCIEKWYKLRKRYQSKKNKAEVEYNEGNKEREKDIDYYDTLQLIQKIFLNSAYGALLNKHCRFFDQRQGASVTMAGRVCLQEMAFLAEDILENEVI